MTAVSGIYKEVLNQGYDRFTTVLHGGFDGLDITEKEPFNNRILENSTPTETTSYTYYSIKRAIDAVSDPEVVEMNLIAIPGLTYEALTTHLLNTCEARADALAIIDLKGDYTPSTEDTTSEAVRLGSVSTAVDNLRDRGLNNSYGSAYFPWVQVRDSISNAILWVPPSVAALGVMAHSERQSEVWFAPAGFKRGGLSSGGAGLPVIGIRQQLTTKNRDDLYEANINPIASFPNEGIVMYGQKTLQVVPSATDRINVRRLLIYVKKEISKMARDVLFDQNISSTWNRFRGRVTPFLDSVKTRYGLVDFRVVLDERTTTADLVDRNIMYAKVLLKPSKAIEHVAVDFVITNTGAAFED